jgi:ABC-type dipeptide/oligopeptide/nickel transport system permease component
MCARPLPQAVWRYVLRRLLALIPIWIAVSFVAFLFIHAIPGGPFDTGAIRSKQATQNLRHLYHLDKPLLEQYGIYIWHVLHGDLGQSMVRRGLHVSDVITGRFPTSAELGLAGLAVSLGVGVPAGIFASTRRNRWPDHAVMFTATAGYAIPNFVLALILILVFGLDLRWLPLGGWGGFSHVPLPAIALGLPWAGLVARMTRASMLEALSQDYIRTANAKGLRPTAVLIRHAFRNALIPLTTLIALLAAELITGSLIIENIFGIPGIGHYMVDSILGADYTMTLGFIIFYATAIFVANFLVDLSYGWIDPRIQFE